MTLIDKEFANGQKEWSVYKGRGAAMTTSNGKIKTTGKNFIA